MIVFSKSLLDAKAKHAMFDTLVVRILLYCSESWGIYNNKEIDNLHIKLCRKILGVNQQTSNPAVLG